MSLGFELDEGFAEIMRAAESQSADSKRLAVRFYVEPMEDADKTNKTGRITFIDTEMIEIRIPGDRDVVRRPASQDDKIKYATLYLAFKQNQSQEAVEGMPLREWASIKRAQAEELAAAGIRTVEHLAAAPDSVLMNLGPLRSLQQKAQDWLRQQQDNSAVIKLRAENDDLKRRLETLEEMVAIQKADIQAARANGGSLPPVAGPDPEVAAMREQIAKLAASVQTFTAPKKRGRPPKATTNGAG